MSVLHQRIIAQPVTGGPAYHPAGTPETPHEMPRAAMAEHRQESHSDLYYTALHPIIAADGAPIPASSGQGVPDVIPAGQP